MANSLFDKIMGKIPMEEPSEIEEVVEEVAEAEEVEEETAEVEEVKEETAEVEEVEEEIAEVEEVEEETAEAENAEEETAETEEVVEEAKPTLMAPQIEHSREKVIEYSMHLYLDLVMDGTYSVTQIYPILYDKVFATINGIYQEAKKPGMKLEVHYGLTYIKEDGPQKEESLSEDGYTNSVSRIMDRLQHITLQGGGPDGHEKINEAIQLSLDKLAYAGNENDYLGIMVFTDSIPAKAELRPIFNCPSNLSFAHIFCYDDMEYIPLFQKVEEDWGMDAEYLEGTRVSRMAGLLNSSEDEISLMVREILAPILQKNL